MLSRKTREWISICTATLLAMSCPFVLVLVLWPYSFKHPLPYHVWEIVSVLYVIAVAWLFVWLADPPNIGWGESRGRMYLVGKVPVWFPTRKSDD